MNPDYLQSFWTVVATSVCYLTSAAEILLPDYAKMSPDHRSRAIVAYDEQLKADPGVAQLYLRRGAARVATKEFDKAISDFDHAIRLDPVSANAYVLRAAARTELKQLDLAIADCDAAIQRQPHLHLAWFHRGICWELKQEWDNAIRDLDIAVRLSSGHAATYRSRGKVRQARHEYAGAISDFTRALRLEPNDAATYVSRGLAWTSRRRLDEAVGDFTQAIRLDPADAETFRRRSQLYFSQEETDKAMADITEAIRLEPNHAASYSNRGWLWHSQREPDQAIADLDEAIRLDPQDPRPYLRRANVHVTRGELGRTLLDAQHVDLLDPKLIPNARMDELIHFVWTAANQKLIDADDENGNTNFARIYRDRGLASGALDDHENAITDLTESIKRASSSSITYIARGQIWMKQRAWNNAIDDFNEAIRLNPNEATAWMNRGIAQAEKQEWITACEDFTEAIRLDPKAIRTFAHRAGAWQALKEWERAIADYDQVIRGGAIFAHRPRTRWQHENPSPLDEKTIETADFAGAPKMESDYSEAIRKIAGSQNEDFSHLFDVSGDKSGEIFTDHGGTPSSKTKQEAKSPSANKVKQLSLAGAETAYNPVCLDPLYLTAFQHRADCWKAKREWSKAAADYEELIRLTPSDPQAYRQLAWLKATCPAADCRNGVEAVRYATEAAMRTHLANATTIATLAAAYAEAGDFEKANEFQMQAIELSSESSNRALLARRKHFEAMEFQQTFDKIPNAPSSDSLNAISTAFDACKQAEWKLASQIESLADAYAAAGKFEEAIATQEKAHALNVAESEKLLLEQAKLYQSGKPYRDESAND